MTKIKINGARNFNDKRKEKLLRAVARAESAINCSEFKHLIVNFNYWYSTGWIRKKWFNPKSFRWNHGMDNKAIYDRIMKGIEVLSPDVDYEIDVDIECVVARHNGVLGFTYPNTVRTWVYSWFFDSADEEEIVGNIIHEWMHKSGFDHEYRYTGLREYTVPYAVGYIAEGVARRQKKKLDASLASRGTYEFARAIA